MVQVSVLLSCLSPTLKTMSANSTVLAVAEQGHHEMVGSTGWARGGLPRIDRKPGVCGKQNASLPSGSVQPVFATSWVLSPTL